MPATGFEPRKVELKAPPSDRSSRVITIPNFLTVVRLGLIPLVLLSMHGGDLRRALLLFLAASFTDTLDGLLARLLKQKTLVGMYLDPIADKLLISSSFLVLAWIGEVPWIVTGLVLARDVAIIAVAAIVASLTRLKRFPPTMLGKLNTTAQMAAIFVVLLAAVYGSGWLVGLRRVLMWVTPALAFASGVQYAIRTSRVLRGGKAENTVSAG